MRLPRSAKLTCSRPKRKRNNQLLCGRRSLDHLQDARFSGAPITMRADSYRVFWFLPQQRDDCLSDSPHY